MPHAPLEPETSNKTTTRNELVPFQRGVIVGRYLSAQKKKRLMFNAQRACFIQQYIPPLKNI